MCPAVVNNWYVIMEGHTISTGHDASRIFFMSFYVFTMVMMCQYWVELFVCLLEHIFLKNQIVITIIVAFILEAFLFRIQYKKFLTKAEGV